MNAVSKRRLLRLAALRALRIGKRHHFSILSAIILVGALMVALTDGRINRQTRQANQPQAQAAPVGPTAAPLPADTLASEPGTVVYYIVDSEEQINLLTSTFRSDSRYVLEQGLPPMPRAWVYFLLFDSPQDEAEGARFLSQMAEMAPREGIGFKVVDLTR